MRKLIIGLLLLALVPSASADPIVTVTIPTVPTNPGPPEIICLDDRDVAVDGDCDARVEFEEVCADPQTCEPYDPEPSVTIARPLR